MDTEIVKGKPLTKEETKALLGFVQRSKTILCKTTNATNNKLKNEEWIRLAAHFNATATNCPRTPQQLRLKWENLKKNSRKRSTKIRMNQIKTGGGPADYIPPDDILDAVSSLLGSTCSGFTVPFGGDREPLIEIVETTCSGDVTDDKPITNDIITTNDAILIPVFSDPSQTGEAAQGTASEMNKNAHKRFTFGSHRTAKKKLEDSKRARDKALTEYFIAKKKNLDTKNTLCNLENERLKLQNNKLLLEVERLKLELEELKKK